MAIDTYAKLTPRTTPKTKSKIFEAIQHQSGYIQGLADMSRTANPDWNIERAARAVNRSPPPVYLKLSLR